MTDNNIEKKENIVEEDESLEPIEETPEIKKKDKSFLYKILIGLSVFLLLLIIIGLVLYFIGFFESTTVNNLENKTKIKEEKIKEEKKYEFDLSTINSKKLNQQLIYLTNKNINQEKLEENEKLENEKKLLEEEKLKEKKKLEDEKLVLLKEKEQLELKKSELENQKLELEKLKQEAITLKEEMINTKKELEHSQTKIIPEENKTVFLKMINVAKIKGELYKDYLDSIIIINPQVKLCRDDRNKIEIYYGPFEKDKIRKDLLEELLKNGFEQSYSLELTQEEFDKRCNY